MPCPADTSGGDDVDRFQLFDDTNHVNCAPRTTSRHHLTASKLHHVPLQGLDVNASAQPLTSNVAFWPSLKAIPLASYYKLHRVPSLTAMTEPDSSDGDMEPVQLPRRESTAEPQERLPQNGVHNKLLDHVVRAPDRRPSPQPTHLSVPGPSSHKVLHEEGSGYVAPKFEGKELQMDQGMRFAGPKWSSLQWVLIPKFCSYGSNRRERLHTP